MKPLKVRSFASRLRGVKVASDIRKGAAVADSLAAQVSDFMGEALREHRFAKPDRQWRFDLAWQRAIPTDLVPGGELWGPWIAVEIEGGAWSKDGGRHNRGSGFTEDLIKYAEALARGWVVLRVSPQMVRDGRAVAWLRRIAERHP